jgi:hypothetical protein
MALTDWEALTGENPKWNQATGAHIQAGLKPGTCKFF